MNGGRVCGGAAVTTAVSRVALLGIVLVLIVVAYFPFALSPPRNQVTRSAEGSLRFGQLNYARTSGTPAWLNDVRTSGRIQIQLEASPQSLRQDASMMMLASDDWDTDFAIGQDHSDLMVWLRRLGSDANGDPPFVIRGVLQPQRWTSVDLILVPGDLRIDVGGRTRLTEHLPAHSLRTWGQGRIALGDEVRGGGPWQGQIRLARVRSPGYAVDYVRPGALSIPVSYLYLEPYRTLPAQRSEIVADRLPSHAVVHSGRLPDRLRSKAARAPGPRDPARGGASGGAGSWEVPLLRPTRGGGQHCCAVGWRVARGSAGLAADACQTQHRPTAHG